MSGTRVKLVEPGEVLWSIPMVDTALAGATDGKYIFGAVVRPVAIDVVQILFIATTQRTRLVGLRVDDWPCRHISIDKRL